jgi:hypothetical protein
MNTRPQEPPTEADAIRLMTDRTDVLRSALGAKLVEIDAVGVMLRLMHRGATEQQAWDLMLQALKRVGGRYSIETERRPDGSVDCDRRVWVQVEAFDERRAA